MYSDIYIGPTISSYTVQDRQQVADIDPSMFLEYAEDEEEDTPCQNCGEDDNEDVLMFCDGCQKMWHTYCVGLEDVPYGAWFCDNCSSQRSWDPRPTTNGRARRGVTQPARRRTRGQQRRQRNLQVSHDQSWNDVWQSVWTRINLDLDFPYEDDETSAAYIRRHRQRSIMEHRSAHEAWQTRLRVAELQGAGNRFREAEATLARLPPAVHSPMQQPQDPEELEAWDAFEQARATSAEPSSARRGKKRKSRSPSPEDQEAEAAPSRIIIKRRRTSQSAAPTPSSSRGRRSSRAEPSETHRPMLADPTGPSFLQSLLQEVEDSSNSTNITLAPSAYRPIRAAGSPPATDHGSPRPSSPAGSPLPSNHSSPRGLSPSPPPGRRPCSPTTLSSSIQPIYASIERPASPPRERNGESRPRPNRSSSNPNIVAQPVPRPRQSRIPQILENSPTQPTVLPHSPGSRRPPANVSPIEINGARNGSQPESSPTRATISLSAKSDIQKLVSAALKPLYNDATISKDEYTTINRDVSRMLYERIGDFDILADDQRTKWEKVAGEEVGRAVVALKADA
jgi:hypothetical protein